MKGGGVLLVCGCITDGEENRSRILSVVTLLGSRDMTGGVLFEGNGGISFKNEKPESAVARPEEGGGGVGEEVFRKSR